MKKIDFMIIGLPRSGTTWASNWFTTDTIHCVHDPLYTTHYESWDEEFADKIEAWKVGVSCTGIWRWTDWLNKHPAKKLILHRDIHEIQESMAAIGMPELDSDSEKYIDSIQGFHTDYKSLFDPKKAEIIWESLVDTKFNPIRHAALVDIEMQPKFSGLSIGPEVTRRLMDELQSIAEGWSK